jgi:O-antigen ligase
MTTADRNALLVIGGGTAAFVAAAAMLDPTSLLGIVALPAVLLVGIMTWRLIQGDKTAAAVLFFLAVFLVDAVFRRRDPTDKSLDWQALLKLALWAMLFGVALLHSRKWYKILLLPSNLPGVMFLIWICITIFTSHVPAYTAVASFSIMAYALGSAYFCNILSRVELFGIMTLALTIFCAISVFYYFFIPEYGRYTYWQNNELYLSLRLAGIAGSANNMGRMASIGLILLVLYGKDFRQFHPAFVPVSAVIMVFALILTHSRSSMAMLLGLILIIYAFNARRFYLLVLAGSAGTLMLLLMVPFADQILTSVARTGSMEEITSLTGRTGVWIGVLQLSAMKPLAGWGYASSIFVLPEYEPVVGFLVPHAHNVFLQLLLTTGWTGTILFTLSVIFKGAVAYFYRDRTVLTLLAILILNGITEGSGFTTLANICTLAFTFSLALPLESRDADDDNHSTY